MSSINKLHLSRLTLPKLFEDHRQGTWNLVLAHTHPVTREGKRQELSLRPGLKTEEEDRLRERAADGANRK